MGSRPFGLALEGLSSPPEPLPLPLPLPLPSLDELEPVLQDHIRRLRDDNSFLPYARLAEWVESLSAHISEPGTAGPTYNLVMAIIEFAAAITGHAGLASCGWLSPRPECQQLRLAMLALMVHIRGFVERAYPVQVQWSALTRACAEVRL
jgi:hypothetical protein